MATSGIPSARKKLERAEFHLKSLQDEVVTFREHAPLDVKWAEKIAIPGHTERLHLMNTMQEIVRVVGQLLDELESAGC